MNQIFAGGLALIIALILWTSKRQSKTSAFFKFNKESFTNSNPTSSFVQKKKITNQKVPKNLINYSVRPSPNQIEKKKQLSKLFASNPNDRLLAIQIASQWDNKKSMPFLRRGLKDFDSRVVIASAAAIASYKGKTIDLKKESQSSRPPRNVSLMR